MGVDLSDRPGDLYALLVEALLDGLHELVLEYELVSVLLDPEHDLEVYVLVPELLVPHEGLEVLGSCALILQDLLGNIEVME